MNDLYEYEVEAKAHEAEYFMSVIESLLEKDGYVPEVHLHEPPQHMEIIEFVKEEKILSVQIDRIALDKCAVRVCSEEVDPRSIVLMTIRVLCSNLIANFMKPIAGKVDRGKLEDKIGKFLKELADRKRKG
jgi:hypothetical protein